MQLCPFSWHRHHFKSCVISQEVCRHSGGTLVLSCAQPFATHTRACPWRDSQPRWSLWSSYTNACSYLVAVHRVTLMSGWQTCSSWCEQSISFLEFNKRPKAGTLTDASSGCRCETSLFGRCFDLLADATQLSSHKIDEAVYVDLCIPQFSNWLQGS